MTRLSAILVLLLPLTLHAQSGVQPPRGVGVTVFAGGTAFTDFQRTNVPETGAIVETHPIRAPGQRRLTASTSGSLAAALAYWPSSNWGLRVRGTWVPTRFEVIVPETIGDPGSTEQYAGVGVWSGEAQVLFRLPTIRHRIMPYGIVGGGVVRYRADRSTPLPPEAHGAFAETDPTKAAVSVGVGAMLGLRPRGWALHFELADQISGTPVPGGPNSEHVQRSSALMFSVGVSWTAR